jgi:hypothetical protein
MISMLIDLGQNKERIGILKNPVSLPDLKKEMEAKYKIDGKETESIIKELLTIGEVQKEIQTNKKGSIMYISKT